MKEKVKCTCMSLYRIYMYTAYMYIHLLVMCSVSTNGERAGLANSKLTIDSLLECF